MKPLISSCVFDMTDPRDSTTQSCSKWRAAAGLRCCCSSHSACWTEGKHRGCEMKKQQPFYFIFKTPLWRLACSSCRVFYFYNVEWKFRRSSFGVLQLLRKVSVSFIQTFSWTLLSTELQTREKKQWSQAESVSLKTSSFFNTVCPGSKHNPAVTAGTFALVQLCARLIFQTCFF